MTTQKPHKICILNHGVELGGAELSLLRTLAALDRHAFQPMLILPERGPLFTAVEEIGVPCRIVPLSPKVLNLRRQEMALNPATALALLPFMCKLKRAIQAFRPALLVTNSTKAHLYGSMISLLTGVRLIWRLHDVISDEGFHPMIRKCLQITARLIPGRVLCVSDTVLRSVSSKGPGGKYYRVYNGIDTEHWTRRSRYKPGSRRSLHVAHIGRLTPLKGQDIFVDAAADVLAECNHFQFSIVGDALYDSGVYAQELHERVSKSGLESKITFTGFIEDIAGFLNNVDIVVNSSVQPEAFGLVAAEAMAMGITVISSDNGGAGEMIDHGKNGYLFPAGDTAALTRQLLVLDKDRESFQKIGVQARSDVVLRFGFDRYIKAFEKHLYESVGK